MEDDGVSSGASHNPIAQQWTIFRSWHGEVSFWREVYVRMIAALAAAGVVYLIAALAGVVGTKPLAVVGIAALVVTTPFLIYWWVDMIAH